MKKNILLLSMITFSSFVIAQVGVNTPNPNATFDITAKNITGTTAEGLLIPRIDRLRAFNMTGITTSTLIYVNSIANGSQTGKAVNIDNVGYYYFDGTNWVKLNSRTSVDNDTNIYNKDGSLADNRVVTQGANTLTFNGTVRNVLSINRTGTNAGTVLSADALNKRIGVGTATPAGKFEIVSDGEGSAAGNDFYFKGFGDSKNPAFYLTSSNGTAASPTNLVNNEQIGGLYFTPRANNTFAFTGGSGILSTYKGNGTTLLTDLSLNTSGAERIKIDESGNVGIGTTTPTNRLHVNGSLKIENGSQAAGRILTSDANGVATWQAPAAGIVDTSIYAANGTITGTNATRIVAQATNNLAFTSTATTGTSHFAIDGSTFSVDAVNNRIGIGTTVPKNLLDLGSGNGKKLALWNSTAGDDFYGFGNAANVLQFFAGANATGDALITLNKNGRVGIGTTTPATNFHTVGTVRLENGTPTAGMVLTSTDGLGTATWQRASSNVVTGTITGGININFENNSLMKYTGNYITLPPGKWVVNITQLIRINGPLAFGNGMFVRSTFSDENLAIGASGTQSSDVIRPTMMSFMVTGNAGNGGGTTINDVKTGSIYINNTSAGNKTYRYIVGSTNLSGNPSNTTTIIGLGGNWSENAIYATAVN